MTKKKFDVFSVTLHFDKIGKSYLVVMSALSPNTVHASARTYGKVKEGYLSGTIDFCIKLGKK